MLIDVTAAAREAGIKLPVALTAAASARCIAVPPGVACQDEAARPWDVLTTFRFAARRAAGDTLFFAVHVRDDDRPGVPPLGAAQGRVRAGRRRRARPYHHAAG